MSIVVTILDSKHVRNMSILRQHVEEIPKVSYARIGAMLVFTNSHRMVAGNSCKTHPFQARFSDHADKIYLHAEINVIQRAVMAFRTELDELYNATLYICRLAFEDSTRVNLHYALAKPCVGCARCI